MCTSFAINTGGSRLVGMNFDNDGKGLKVASLTGQDLTFLVGVGQAYFPSFGVSPSGIFVNDLMADDSGKGKYARQNHGRWVSTKLVQSILGGQVDEGNLGKLLNEIEIVNNPGLCSHNLIVAPDSHCWVVEHGIRNFECDLKEQTSIALTNFPLSRYPEIQPASPEGSGAERYCLVRERLSQIQGPICVGQAFEILKSAKQLGEAWKTELSLVYDMNAKIVHLSLNGCFQPMAEFSLGCRRLRFSSGEDILLTKSGLPLIQKSLSQK